MKKLFLAFLLFSSSAIAQTNQTPVLPDPVLTPGAVLPVTAAEICVPGYSKTARDVPATKKLQVFIRYKIDRTIHRSGEYEVDHLISLQLGGSNDISNLWPQFYEQPYGARIKDKLENRLHAKVCKGELTLEEAQRLIATDWIKAYNTYYGPIQPNSQPVIENE